MRLGIVVTDAIYLFVVAGLIDAARARNWQTECFLTDTGVKLLGDADFVERARSVPNSVAVCEHSLEHYAQDMHGIEALSNEIVFGGQYQDAELVRRCDKVLVF